MARRNRWIAAAVAAVLLVTALFLAASRRQQKLPAVGTSFVMNTVVEYKFYGKNAESARQLVEAALRELESRMSLYLEGGSELQTLNANAGKGWTPLSQDTFSLLARCKELGSQSEGVFAVTVAPLTQLWGITSEHPQVPKPEELARALALVGDDDLELDEKTRSARLARAGQAVDLGGIAKGYACDLARRVALESGVESGYISIGGNLMVIGAKPDGEPFTFGVRDPRGSANDYLAKITLPDSTMATSGDYERFFEQDGKRYHHILDPATGYPADGGLLSVSVVTPDGAWADYMSTFLFVKGRTFALEHLNSYDCGLVLVDSDRNVYVSDRLRESVTPADKSGAYHFEVRP